jgi:hypothetical protein
VAKLLDFNLLPRLKIAGAYIMIGETRVSHFHQTAEIDVYVFADEDARRQRLSETEHELHRPIKIITVATTFATYEEYIQEAARALAAAGYKLITEERATASVEPRGLKELLENATDY